MKSLWRVAVLHWANILVAVRLVPFEREPESKVHLFRESILTEKERESEHQVNGTEIKTRLQSQQEVGLHNRKEAENLACGLVTYVEHYWADCSSLQKQVAEGFAQDIKIQTQTGGHRLFVGPI